MKRKPRSIQAEINVARRTWGNVGTSKLAELRVLIERNGLSLALGDICYLDDRWYVTHAGLLRLARRRHCAGIKTNLERDASDSQTNRWVFKATVYTTLQSKGFVGYGDADPSNTSSLVRGAEMRVAETRAVNRALRKAYGIGLCSVEELGSHQFPVERSNNKDAVPRNGNSSSNAQPRLRDKLCLLIRNYELDPTLVKRYAADFCGTETLRDASRDLVEVFVSTISKEAANNRAALVCKLNSYNQPEEVRS